MWVDSLENAAPIISADNCKAHINPVAELRKVLNGVGRDSDEDTQKYKPAFRARRLTLGEVSWE